MSLVISISRMIIFLIYSRTRYGNRVSRNKHFLIYLAKNYGKVLLPACQCFKTVYLIMSLVISISRIIRLIMYSRTRYGNRESRNKHFLIYLAKNYGKVLLPAWQCFKTVYLIMSLVISISRIIRLIMYWRTRCGNRESRNKHFIIYLATNNGKVLLFIPLPTYYPLPTTDYRLPTTDYRLPTTLYRLLTLHFPLF